MKESPTHPTRLPVKSWAVLISLGGATVLLVVIYVLAQMALISTETAVWAAVSVFIATAVVEVILFTIVTMHMMQKVGEDARDQNED